MMGLFTIQPPSWALARGGAKKGALGALGMGALLGIVAAPCVGPAVAALLAYVGARQDPLLGFALFFALSLGLGLPYLLLGALGGAARAALPRSGAWMVKAKKIFALPILAAALYFAWTAWNTARAAPLATSAAWPHATLASLDTARAGQRAVVLDFRADWCLPCRKMEHEIFAREDVKQAARASKIELLQVDLTRAGS
jgi:thiol:disulfide interchange protein DsbD